MLCIIPVGFPYIYLINDEPHQAIRIGETRPFSYREDPVHRDVGGHRSRHSGVFADDRCKHRKCFRGAFNYIPQIIGVKKLCLVYEPGFYIYSSFQKTLYQAINNVNELLGQIDH